MMGHVINLMSIAFADGNIVDEEKQFIFNVAEDLGLTQEEFDHCLAIWKETDEGQLGFATPETDDEKIAFLKNMTLMMMLDGEIDENERQYIVNAAEHYGFNGEQAVDYLIDQIHEEYGGGGDAEEEDDLFEYVDDEQNISSVRYDFELKHIEDAFDTIYLSALRNEEARNIFLAIPDIDTRLYRLKEEQLELVKKTADLGYPLAKYVLGRYYQVVKPEGSSMNDAGELLKEAADNGIADAYCALATMVWQGYYGSVSRDTYDNLKNEALENGSPMAIRRQLEDTIYGHRGMKANPKKVVDTIAKKIFVDEDAEKTYPYLYAVMADAYKEMANAGKADECYEKAIDLGYFEAYASRFMNKVIGPDAEFYRQQFDMFLDFGCDEQAPSCFLYRATENIHFYEQKKDAEKPAVTQKIKEDLEEAVRLGEGRAAFYLGYCYYYGSYGFEEDNNQAWQWFLKGVDMEDGLSFGGLAQMVKDGICPEGLPEEYAELCMLNGLRRDNFALLEEVAEAYRSGKLKDYADEIEQLYLPMLEEGDSIANVSTVLVVNTEGKASLFHVEKTDWGKVGSLIGARRIAPVRVNGLDDIAKQLGLTERLTAWVDYEAPRKGLQANIMAEKFFPGLIAGEMIFTLADNLYDPVLFYGIDDAQAVANALGAQLVTDAVQEMGAVDKEYVPLDYTKINLKKGKGYMARIESDNSAHILTSTAGGFKMLEEDIYDPTRLQNVYDVGEKLGLPGRLTLWTDNTALRKQIVMVNTFGDNPVGMRFYPGHVADNIFVAMEDENYNPMVFDDLEQLKQTLLALGVKPEDIVMEERL